MRIRNFVTGPMRVVLRYRFRLAISGLGLLLGPVPSSVTDLHVRSFVWFGSLDALFNSKAGLIEIPCLGSSSLSELHLLEDVSF